jgi:nucleotide-binding universal stress UspA family protein
MSTSPGRVIVGVSESMAGLHALRCAVSMARARGCRLTAVRTWTYTAATATEFDLTVLGFQLAADATVTIGHAFDAAMGGVPTDIEVQPLAVQGAAGHGILAQVTSVADLVVLGRRRGGRLNPLASRTARYCLRHGTCAILLVPPPDSVCRASTTALSRRQRRDVERFTRLMTLAATASGPDPTAVQRWTA